MAAQTRILIVEDEVIIAMDLQETLCEAGYTVSGVVASGEEALAHCAAMKPDLVLMDIRLQGRLNGIETAQQLRERYAIPSVLLTAHYDPATLSASQQAGVFAYLIKPYDARELCATLATALSRAHSEGELQRQLQELRALSPAAPENDGNQMQILTLCSPLTIKFRGKILSGDLFTRTQREMLSLLLAAPQLRVDREFLEAELWPESPSKKARAAFDASLLRFRRLFDDKTESSAGRDLFSLKNGMLSIENSFVDLHRFHALDEEGCGRRRCGLEAEAIDFFVQATALWQREFLSGLSCHHNVLTVRHYNTQRVFEIALWLAEAFAARQRPDDAIEALRLALRALPASEKAAGNLYCLLMTHNRTEQGRAVLKDFSRELIYEGLDRQQAAATIRRIEQRALLERCQHRSTR